MMRRIRQYRPHAPMPPFEHRASHPTPSPTHLHQSGIFYEFMIASLWISTARESIRGCGEEVTAALMTDRALNDTGDGADSGVVGQEEAGHIQVRPRWARKVSVFNTREILPQEEDEEKAEPRCVCACARVCVCACVRVFVCACVSREPESRRVVMQKSASQTGTKLLRPWSIR